MDSGRTNAELQSRRTKLGIESSPAVSLLGKFFIIDISSFWLTGKTEQIEEFS